jgi:stage III sporulation protein AB
MVAGGYYKRRIDELERARSLIALLERYLVFTMASPGGLWSSWLPGGEDGDCDYVREAQSRVARGEDFDSAWRSAVWQSAAPLGAQDRELVSQVGDILGASDLETQRGQLALLKERLQARLDEARNSAQTGAKLCTTLGTLLGLAFAVFCCKSTGWRRIRWTWI